MKRVLFLLTLLLLSMGIYAEEISFTASAPRSVVQGTQFRIEYKLNSNKGNNFRAPDFEGLSVLFGPATSSMSSTSYVNGKRTSEITKTFTYTLQAEKEGKYSIPSATIEVDGKSYKSNALTIQVLPPDKAAASNSGQSSSSASSVSSDQLFMRLLLSRTKVYEQEAILATFKLYTRAEGIQLESANFPSFEGFVVQQIDLPSNTSFELENYDGINYKTAVIKQSLLFPQRSGEITIDAGDFDMIVQVPRQVDMNSFFGGSFRTYQDVRKKITTPKRTIHVDALPTGKPASYRGAVGKFSISSSISNTEVKANEAITLKVTIKGTGNLKYMKNPVIKFPNDFEEYDPKVEVNAKATTGGVVGSRSIEYTVVPRFGGEFTLPAIEYAYFDTASKSYKTLKTEPYTITVEKGDESTTSTGMVSNFTNKEALSLINTDIRFIKTTPTKLEKEPRFIYGGWGYWLWYIVPLLLGVVAMILYSKQAKESANVALMKTKKANKVAAKRLKLAGKYVNEQNKEAFYEELLRATWGYLSDKLNIPLSSLTKNNVEQELLSFGADTELVNRFMYILDTCEFARYAPSNEGDAMDKLYKEAVDSIGTMENRVKKQK